MLPERKNVLVINMGPDLFEKVAPLLDQEEFEVDRFPRASMALEITDRVTFDVLVAVHPLPDIGMQAFLDRVRGPESPCRSTPLLLLASEDDIGEARKFIGKGANRIVSIDESADRLQQEVGRLLAVAPRRHTKVMVRVNALVDEARHMAICQTENISESGMLLRAGEAYPLGTEVEFEFHLPGEQLPIRGAGTVVRHTTPGREPIKGMGIAFDRFDAGGEKKLDSFLARQG